MGVLDPPHAEGKILGCFCQVRGEGGGARETSEIIVHSNEKWFAMEKCKYTVYRLHIVFFFVFR